jgi:MFS-type transporter involved in bile tolerance (Atg22 family)
MPFLIANMFWNDGLNAVLAVVAVFFQQELGVSSATIGFALLFAQSMGILGASFFHVVVSTPHPIIEYSYSIMCSQ